MSDDGKKPLPDGENDLTTVDGFGNVATAEPGGPARKWRKGKPGKKPHA